MPEVVTVREDVALGWEALDQWGDDAAGVNAKAPAVYMGHASVTITLDRYGHLMPGNEEEAAGLLDTYLSRTEALS